MAQGTRPIRKSVKPTPYWSQMLRALRDARGITQEGWAAQLGYSRATVRRWESGRTVPSADAERAIISLCREKRLFRAFHEGPLLGVQVTSEWIADLLAMARLQVETQPSFGGDTKAPFLIPPVHYASNGSVSIAYQVFGKGSVTFVVTPGTISHRELDWENPGMRAFLLHLAEFGRVVIYDKRATGLSDRVSEGSIEDRINDLRAVMDATESDQVVLVGFTEGGPISIKFATTWPHRVKALVLYGASAQVPDISPETNARSFDQLQRVWGTTDSGFLEKFAPSASFDQQELEWWARFQRMGASPGAVRDLNAMNANLDVLSLLPDLHVPTLVVHRTGDLVTPFQEAVHMARVIPGAQLVALDGDDHMAWAGDPKEISGAILDFVSHLKPAPSVNWVLTTMVCFSHSADVHDTFWELVRQQPSFSASREVHTLDNERLLTFDSPSSAIRCVLELLHSGVCNEFDVGIGIHTGEVNRDSRAISGDAVIVCTELTDLATPGVVLVSETVARLTTARGVSFRHPSLKCAPELLDGIEILQLESGVE